MSDTYDPLPKPTPLRKPNTPWQGRVVYADRAGGYARRPGELLCLNRHALKRVYEILTPGQDPPEPVAFGCDGEEVYRVEFDEDATRSVEDLVDLLAEEQLPSEPNYVMFANPMYANPMYANPMYANPMYANPMYANPMYANPSGGQASGSFAGPVYANPVYASPVYANPVYANPMYANAYICDGDRPSTARPAEEPERPWKPYSEPTKPVGTVVILDTGIASSEYELGGKTIDFCPPMLAELSVANQQQWEIPDNDPLGDPGEKFIDPVSGHGTFIAGIIQSLAPKTKIVPQNIVTSYGDVDVLTVMDQVVQLCEAGLLGPHTVVNMSFGGYADENMRTLRRAIRCIRSKDAVVVASAGNDATSRPSFPACLPGVVGVGALDPIGPAPYSNHGSWVDACAPGSDLVSAFYRNFDGKMELPPMPGSADPDAFASWGRWTGTSFAAPIVAAALVREMKLTHCDADTAVARVIESPGLFRIPGLGAVVNLDLGDLTCL